VAAISRTTGSSWPPGGEFQWEQVDLRGQPQGYLGNQMLLFKSGRRSPGDKALQEMKILMKAIPEATLADLAAYFASRQ
jgi:cytochrome c553